MITWARYVHESRLEDYHRLGWMVSDVMYSGAFVVWLCVWVCPCNMVEPAK